jgi:hypothetical protein
LKSRREISDAEATLRQALRGALAPSAPAATTTLARGGRAALIAHGAEDRLRALALGQGSTLLYSAPSPSRTPVSAQLFVGETSSFVSTKIPVLAEWLSHTSPPAPEGLAAVLLCAAASAVLERETAFHEGQLIEFRTVVAGPTSRGDQITLADARTFDDVVKPGEELGFSSTWDDWLFPLLDWLYAAPS